MKKLILCAVIACLSSSVFAKKAYNPCEDRYKGEVVRLYRVLIFGGNYTDFTVVGVGKNRMTVKAHNGGDTYNVACDATRVN